MRRALTFMVIATARAALSSLFVPYSPPLPPPPTLLQDDGDGRERHRKGLGAVGEHHRGTEVNVLTGSASLLLDLNFHSRNSLQTPKVRLTECTLSQTFGGWLEIYLILSTCSRCELLGLSHIPSLELFSSPIKSRRNFILLLLVCFHSGTGRLQHLALSAERFGASVGSSTRHVNATADAGIQNERQ